MSISIIQQPSVFLLSAGNDNYSTISGTTLNAPNVFEYKFIADIYVNGILQVTLKSFPDPQFGFGVFNTRNILTSFISFDFFATDPSPYSPWNLCPNSSCRAQLVFGEEYISGSTFIQNRNIISGSTNLYINASQSFPNEVNGGLALYSPTDSAIFSQDQYLTDTIITNPGGINSQFIANTYPNLRQFLYVANQLFNTQFGGPIVASTINIKTKNIAGGNVGSYQFVSPFTSNQWTDVMAVAVGYGQLLNLTSGSPGAVLVSGSWPLFGPTVTSYLLTVDAPPPTSATTDATQWQQPKFNIQIDCGRFAAGAYTISWLNSLGGFDSWLFNKKNETTQNKNTQSYKKIPGKLNSNGSYSLTSQSRQEVPYYTVLKDSIVMYTDFLIDTDVLLLKSLISSPCVFMTDQSGLTTAVVVKDNSYRINKHVNQKIYSLEMTVEQSYNDYRQIL